MATYRNFIAANPPVTNHDCEGLLVASRAPPVAAGAPLNPEDVLRAGYEIRARKRLKLVFEQAVTNEELEEAVIRENVVIAEHVFHRVPQVNAPDWAVQLQAAVAQVQAAVAPLQAAVAQVQAAVAPEGPIMVAIEANGAAIAALQATSDANAVTVGELQVAVGQVQAAIEGLQADIEGLQADRESNFAGIKNQDFKRRNKEKVIVGNVFRELEPLLKEIAHNGEELAGHPVFFLPQGAPFNALTPFYVGPAFNVGDPIPSPPFPLNLRQLRTLTHQKLSVLSVLYNNDFGIVDEDSIEDRRDKFEKFIS